MNGARRIGLVAVTVTVAVAVAGAGLLAVGSAAAQEDTGWVIDAFAVVVEVAPDGTVAVTEEIAVDFRDLERRGIFREIPARYRLSTDAEHAQVPEGLEPGDVLRAIDISAISVTSTAPADLELTRPDRFGQHNLRIRIGDPDVTVTGPQRYRIRYEVRGALNRFDDVDELNWNMTGDHWPVPIRRAQATVRGPGIARAACFRGPPGSTEPCAEAATSDQTVGFTTGELQPGEGMTVAVGFAPGAVDVAEPLLVEQWDLQRSLIGSPAAVPLAVATFLLGFGAVGMLAYRQGRDRVNRGGLMVDGQPDEADPVRRSLVGPRSVPVQFRPPEDLRPGQLGVLVDERVDPVDVSATIVDLAVRGYLTIEETSRGRIRRKRDWTLARTDKPAEDLRGYERTLLDALFDDRDTVALSALKGTFSSDYDTVAKQLYADAVAHGWFPRSPHQTRMLWRGLGFLALVVTAGLLVAASLYTTAALAVAPLVGAAALLTAAHRWMPRRTPKGSRLLTQTLGFREFITTAEGGRMAFAEQEQLFVTYLPYAVVFDAVDRWAAAFAHLGAAAAAGGVGAWYLSPHGPGDFSSLSRGLSSFSHTVGSDLSYSPPSSSSGGSGGSSGGGFGGGGGGSW